MAVADERAEARRIADSRFEEIMTALSAVPGVPGVRSPVLLSLLLLPQQRVAEAEAAQLTAAVSAFSLLVFLISAAIAGRLAVRVARPGGLEKPLRLYLGGKVGTVAVGTRRIMSEARVPRIYRLVLRRGRRELQTNQCCVHRVLAGARGRDDDGAAPVGAVDRRPYPFVKCGRLG